METKSPFEQFDDLRIDTAGKLFLAEAARWTTFLAILGYIGIGFIVIVALFMMTLGASLSSRTSLMPLGGGAVFGIFYLIIAAFYFIPIHYLYRFSSNMKLALRTNDQATLTKAFEYIKSHYKFIGIITIIFIGIYVLMILWLMFTSVTSFM